MHAMLLTLFFTNIFVALILTYSDAVLEDTSFPECGYSPIPNTDGITLCDNKYGEKESFLIIGGQPARRGSWPWMVSLHGLYDHFCGGSIIANAWILTAAHCIFGLTEEKIPKISIVLGKHSQSEVGDDEYRIHAKSGFIHPDYVNETLANDIGLLKLERRIEFHTNKPILPVCLPEKGEELEPGVQVYAIGWGDTRPGTNNSPSDILQQVMLPVVDCIHHGVEKKNIICVFCEKGSTCTGDSGSPVVALKENLWVQYGIVSGGTKNCGENSLPSEFTKVSAYISWIRNITKNAAMLF